MMPTHCSDVGQDQILLRGAGSDLGPRTLQQGYRPVFFRTSSIKLSQQTLLSMGVKQHSMSNKVMRQKHIWHAILDFARKWHT